MRLLLLVAVTCTAILGPVASNSASGSGSSSSADLPQDLPEYAFAPQLWTQTVPPTAAIGATLSLSKPLYKSSVNDSYQLQVLSAPDGSITTLLIATDPTTPAVVYGTGTLASFVPNVGEILTAGPGTTRTSVVIATTRAVFLFDTSFDFNNTFTPSIYLPSDPILAVSWAPTTGLYLVVQSQHLTWWNATADRTLGASLNVTTPLVGPVTAQCGMDGVCWIGDSLATFVVAYASSALIQTMAMRGQWPTDATMAPLIRPLSGRRAVMAWGVRVGLLTSQQAGNLGMNWSSTQTSDTTALGVFPALGQTGLVVTGHNVSVTVYDLASGSPIGSTGQLQAAQLRPSQQWTTIEVDTSAQPYLLLATGVNCAASWELVNATGAIATAAPAWSASDAVKGGFSTLSIPCVPAMGSAGATCWLLQMAYPGIGYLTAIVLSPQQQAVLGSFQTRRLGGVVVTTVVAQTHTVVVVAGRQGLFAFDAAATPVLAPPPAAFLFASTLDAATSTVYVVGWLTLGQVGVFRVPQGATTPTLIAAWAVANTSYPRTANAEVLLALGGTRLIVSGTFLTSSPFTTPWFGAVIDLQTGVLLFKELMSAGVVGTIVDSVNSNLIFITQTSYNVVAWSTGTVSALPLTFNITGFTRIAQTGNRVLLRGFRGYWVVNSLTAALMFSRAATRVYPAFSNDGGIVECVYDEATSASKLNQYSFNFDLFRSVEVPCTSAPLQTPDGSVYVGVQGPSDPLSSYQSTYLARANFSNASLTPAVELWREVGAAVGQMIYNPTHQLMVYWAPSFGWQACVDLVRGVTLWNNTVDANYGNVDAAQGLVAGATNVLWADPAQFGTTKKAINLFTGDIIESIVSDAQTDMTYVTSQVVGGVARPIVIVVQFEGVATWTNLAVTDVSLPSDFRSSTLPLFTTPLLPLRLPANKLATPSTGSSGLAGELLGAAAGVALVAGAAALFLRFRRRRTAEDGSTYQDLPSVALPAVSDV